MPDTFEGRLPPQRNDEVVKLIVDPQYYIEKLGLKPLPTEGGYFRETYRSSEFIDSKALPVRYTADKPFCTAIYYLLTAGTFSAMHRLPTDEIYHFYLGAPVIMLLLYPNGKGDVVALGQDIEAGEKVQQVVPAGTWQGASLREDGNFALMGTTMSPGYDHDDFELGVADNLVKGFPEYTDLIRRLTR